MLLDAAARNRFPSASTGLFFALHVHRRGGRATFHAHHTRIATKRMPGIFEKDADPRRKFLFSIGI
ncbi:hypothetical protein FG93_04986 [Bosea sp. LC85]|nr:hypothetical protein FG93_04986 [Bosea sp. LC85]